MGPGWYLIGKEEKKEILDVLKSKEFSRYRFNNHLSNIPKVLMFEREFKKFINARYCIGMNSCTSSLLSIFFALGIGPGDEVIVPGYTFVASVASIIYVGATPILSEIDETLTIDPIDVEKKVTSKTKAILAVHMLGASCNMLQLRKIAKKNNIYLIEDVAQACGGEYKGKKLGTIGDAGAFSLNIFKVITAGDGGVFITNNKKLFQRVFSIHDHGFSSDGLRVIDKSNKLGLNFRMHELTGAIAVAQIRKIRGILNKLRRNKKIFEQNIKKSKKMNIRLSNDVDGECGTCSVLIFKSIDIAEKIARKIHSITLINSGKHYYGNMVRLLNQAYVGKRNTYFKYNKNQVVVNYKKGQLPKTDNILSRSIAISIGVRDTYLGTGYGVDITSNDQTIIKKAEKLSSIIRETT